MQSKGLCSVAKVFLFFIMWLFPVGRLLLYSCHSYNNTVRIIASKEGMQILPKNENWKLTLFNVSVMIIKSS